METQEILKDQFLNHPLTLKCWPHRARCTPSVFVVKYCVSSEDLTIVLLSIIQQMAHLRPCFFNELPCTTKARLTKCIGTILSSSLFTCCVLSIIYYYPDCLKLQPNYPRPSIKTQLPHHLSIVLRRQEEICISLMGS